jgi:hypothetical protein
MHPGSLFLGFSLFELSCSSNNGRISNKWQRLQNIHLQRYGIKMIMLTQQSWSTTMIAINWKDFFEIWEEHNNLVHHGTVKSSQDLAKRSCKSWVLDHLRWGNAPQQKGQSYQQLISTYKLHRSTQVHWTCQLLR